MKKFLEYSRVQKAHCPPPQAFGPIQRIGGHTGWYFANWLWRTRGFMDRCIGGVGFRRDQRGPEQLQPGDIVDFWRVESYEQDRLLRLVAEAKMPGSGWLQFEVAQEGSGSLVRLVDVPRNTPGARLRDGDVRRRRIGGRRLGGRTGAGLRGGFLR
jgi:hypothetical protein